MRNNKRERIGFDLIFLLVAAIASYYYYSLRFLLTDPGGTEEFFALAASNAAPKPWQYRVLIPFTANLLSHLHLPRLDSLDPAGRLLELGAVFLLVIAFRYYLSLLFRNRIATAVSCFFILPILPFHIYFPRPYHPFYWYDTPSILFFTLGLISLYRQRWAWYYPVFILGTFNRETTCFLTFIYLFTAIGRNRLGSVLRHCAAQFALWFAIRGALFYLYLNNPGPQGFEWYDRPSVPHVADNLAFLSNYRNYPFFFSVLGFIWIPVLLFHRLITDAFVKRSLLVVFPFFAGMLCVANIYELRIFEELIPVFLAAFLLILRESLRREDPLANS